MQYLHKVAHPFWKINSIQCVNLECLQIPVDLILLRKVFQTQEATDPQFPRLNATAFSHPEPGLARGGRGINTNKFTYLFTPGPYSSLHKHACIGYKEWMHCLVAVKGRFIERVFLLPGILLARKIKLTAYYLLFRKHIK